MIGEESSGEDFLPIEPAAGPVRGAIRPPGSKSITNRALVCAALAEGDSLLSGALGSEDTRVMLAALEQLGIEVEHDPRAATVAVTGCGGLLPRADLELFAANSGTTIRFLTALTTLGRGRYRLSGVERMHERPIADLLVALNQLGADARSETGSGCPPVVVEASGLLGGECSVRGDISSQFLSGLLMATPRAAAPVKIAVEGELVSQPYIHMTLEVMRSFGIEAQAAADLSHFTIPAPQSYRGGGYAIEPDASAASYFWAAAAITGGRVLVEGLSLQALQGDVDFCRVLGQMGCTVVEEPEGISLVGGLLRGVEVNMNAISDTVQTLAVVALFAEGPTTIRGVAHIRHKETDRIGDLARELRKLGARVEELDAGLRIHPGPLRGAELDTYNDHRMAMSLALAGLKIPGVVIRNPGCTVKTYPHFFQDLAALRDSP